MKFELKPPYAQLSDEELLDDLRHVAKVTGKRHVNRTDYESHGKFNRRTIQSRFGSWKTAHERAGLAPHSREAPTRESLIDDLKQAANVTGKSSVSLVEYRRIGRWSERPFYRVFGGWVEALAAAGLDPDPHFNARIEDETLFENLESVWTCLGRQPSYSEFHRPLTKISRGTYCNRFGSWRGALEAFVVWANSDGEQTVTDAAGDSGEPDNADEHIVAPLGTLKRLRRTPREVNLRLRFRVLQRDSFTCKACGRSPATVLGLSLQVDHVIPWSAGGETVIENLQTLCEPCNLGKGNFQAGATV